MTSTTDPEPAAPAATATATARRGYPIYVLVMLIVVYTFNFIDRQILGVLAPAIKADLNLSDTQLGLMGGLAFALFYTGLGIPVGWLADRSSRTWIMTGALSLWSFFTVLCGFATSFTTLFIARMGVGFGEAGGTAPAYSLITDYFPPKSRARALAAYSFGIPIGSALGIVFGGMVASKVDWRVAFIVVGLAGLVIAPIFRLTVKEPARNADAKPVAIGPALARIARTPTFWGLALGTACSSIVNYGVMFWLPSFFLRSFGFTLPQVSLYFGSIVFIGGMAGIWGGGWLADKLRHRGRSTYVLVPAAAFVIAIPFYAGAFLSRDPLIAYLLMLPPQALGLMWAGPVVAALQHISPPAMRATISAAWLFITNLLGLACGTLFFGVMSDLLAPHFGKEALRYSLVSGLVFYALAAIILYAARRIEKDWID